MFEVTYNTHLVSYMGFLSLSEVILFPTSFVIKFLLLPALRIESFLLCSSLVTCQMTDLSQM